MKLFWMLVLVACSTPPAIPLRHIELRRQDSTTTSTLQPDLINVFRFEDTLPGYSSASVIEGQTTCDTLTGRISVGLAKSVMENATRRYWVLMHENVHVNQIRREASCGRFIWRYNNDEEFYIATEAEAYCVVYEEELRRGIKHSESLVTIAKMISADDPKYTQAYVAAKLPCKTRSLDPNNGPN